MALFLVRCSTCLVLLTVLLGGGRVEAQDPVPEPSNPEDAVPDSVDQKWVYDADARLNLSQAAYRNWEKGAGNSSFSLAMSLDGGAVKRGAHWIQAHNLRLAFGLIRQEGRDLRKAEDQIRWNSSLRYEGDGIFRLLNPTVAVNLRTQFAKGFEYGSNPFGGEVPEGDPRLDLESPVQTDQFFAPAFITESLGLTYEPIPAFTLRLGAASKQTVVTVRDFRVLYNLDDTQVARVEAGTELAAALDRQLTENIRYRSRLDAFLSFNQLENPPDARWGNTLNLSVNSWLSTDLQVVALFDRDITDVIQVKETISVGLSFTLL